MILPNEEDCRSLIKSKEVYRVERGDSLLVFESDRLYDAKTTRSIEEQLKLLTGHECLLLIPGFRLTAEVSPR